MEETILKKQKFRGNHNVSISLDFFRSALLDKAIFNIKNISFEYLF